MGRPGDARPCSWEALFPPPEDAPAGTLRLPSGEELARFAAALGAVAQSASRRAAEKAGRLASGEALPPPDAAPDSSGGAGATSDRNAGAAPPAQLRQQAACRNVEAACRVLTHGAAVAAELLAPQEAAAAPPEEAATAARLRAARAAVLLENLAGNVHGRQLRAFLREEAAEAEVAVAPAPPAAGRAAYSVDALSEALSRAWACEGSPQEPRADSEPPSWLAVSVGARPAPFVPAMSRASHASNLRVPILRTRILFERVRVYGWDAVPLPPSLTPC